MLRLSRKADYALISLGYLAEHADRVLSAREIAEACGIPAALLMNILKELHQKGILTSVRGASGGYRIAVDLQSISLFDLMQALDGHEDGDTNGMAKMAIHGPAQALQYRLGRFMSEVTLADLVMPGRRIDVPLESIRRSRTMKLSVANAV
jgi:Rrf2 family protein